MKKLLNLLLLSIIVLSMAQSVFAQEDDEVQVEDGQELILEDEGAGEEMPSSDESLESEEL